MKFAAVSIRKSACVALICVTSALWNGLQALADVTYQHVPPTLQEIPAPGKKMTLSVILPKEVLSVGLKVRALITRDGRLMEMQDPNPTLDPNDHALYKFTLPAPLGDMTYQFLFADKMGQASASKQFRIQRRCIPDVQLTTVTKSQGTVTKEDAMLLVSEASGLERDIEQYEHIISLLNDIQSAVEKR